jgi:hypothetical protein
MKRSNHQLQGVLFVVVCVLVALVAYMAIHGSARKNSDGNVQTAAVTPDNSSTIDVSANDVPADVSNDTAPQEESGISVYETAEDALKDNPTMISQAELAERRAKANAERGDCDAIVNVDLNSVNIAGLSMAANSKFEHVTQFLRDTNTGESVFCDKSNHCFPANVEQDGRSVKAIELPFCEVKGEPSRTVNGIEAYPVVWNF